MRAVGAPGCPFNIRLHLVKILAKTAEHLMTCMCCQDLAPEYVAPPMDDVDRDTSRNAEFPRAKKEEKKETKRAPFNGQELYIKPKKSAKAKK